MDVMRKSRQEVSTLRAMLVVSLAGLGLGFASNVTLDDRIVDSLTLFRLISILSFSRCMRGCLIGVCRMRRSARC